MKMSILPPAPVQPPVEPQLLRRRSPRQGPGRAEPGPCGGAPPWGQCWPRGVASRVQALNNWGLVLQELAGGRAAAERGPLVAASTAKFRRAIRLRPEFDRACYNLGTVFYSHAVALQVPPPPPPPRPGGARSR